MTYPTSSVTRHSKMAIGDTWSFKNGDVTSVSTVTQGHISVDDRVADVSTPIRRRRQRFRIPISSWPQTTF